MGNESLTAGRRIYVRVEVDCLVRYSRLNAKGDADVKTVNAVNISEGGLLFKTYEELPISSTLKLSINLVLGREPVQTYAKIVHCSRGNYIDSETAFYRTGVSFMDLTEVDRNTIKAFVQDAMNDRMGRRLIKKTYWWQFWKIKRRESIQGTFDAFFSIRSKYRKP